jgi:hypothetical protein
MTFYGLWRNSKKYRSVARNRLASICFADDRWTTPVQAADLLAYGIVNDFKCPFASLFSTDGAIQNQFELEHWDSEKLAKEADIIADYGTIV